MTDLSPAEISRIARVRAEFPNLVDDLDWSEAFRDNEVLGQAMRDVIRINHGEVRRGQRVTPEPVEGMRRWRQLTGSDYSMEMFPRAFHHLAAALPVGELLDRLAPMTPDRLTRLQAGKSKPTMTELATIAAAFGRKPTWFHEYRVNLVSASVAATLASNPERSAFLANQIES